MICSAATHDLAWHFQHLHHASALPSFDEVVAWLRTLQLTNVWAICFGILLLCGFGLPIPEDITLVTCGYLTYLLVPADGSRGHPLAMALTATAVGMAGVLIGDMTMFGLGRKFGGVLAKRWPFRSILGSGRQAMAEDFLQKRGSHVLFSARFMPGLRSVVFFTSGTLGVKLGQFIVFDGLAALLSVPALVLSSWYFGEQIQEVIDKARKAEHGILIVIVAIAALAGGKWWLDHRKAARQRQAAAGSDSR